MNSMSWRWLREQYSRVESFVLCRSRCTMCCGSLMELTSILRFNGLPDKSKSFSSRSLLNARGWIKEIWFIPRYSSLRLLSKPEKKCSEIDVNKLEDKISFLMSLVELKLLSAISAMLLFERSRTSTEGIHKRSSAFRNLMIFLDKFRWWMPSFCNWSVLMTNISLRDRSIVKTCWRFTKILGIDWSLVPWKARDSMSLIPVK